MTPTEQEIKFLGWLAGFIDGEGSFNIRIGTSARNWIASLGISLRDDDLDILLTIQEKLGLGKVYREWYPPRNPTASWVICSQRDCQAFVLLMAEHPLLTKKRRDFETWREAVAEIAQGEARNISRLKYLKQKLELTRKYERADSTPLIIETAQLILPWEDDGDA